VRAEVTLKTGSDTCFSLCQLKRWKGKNANSFIDLNSPVFKEYNKNAATNKLRTAILIPRGIWFRGISSCRIRNKFNKGYVFLEIIYHSEVKLCGI